ncbi:LPS translocon maturation chaperone LptM [Nitrosomonas mobilis]
MHRFFLIALIFLTLFACGHKAPLYLPAPEATRQGKLTP